LIADSKVEAKERIDWMGTALSALGLGLVVLALLKAGEWGFLHPKSAPSIGGNEITPFGFSVVPFLIAAGFFTLYGFFAWEARLVRRGGSPLMHPQLLRKLQLRNGLVMLMAQQAVIGGMFFVIPIYLQYVLLKNAFDTGLKLAPMSIAMLFAAFSGPRLAVKFSPRKIVSVGLILVIAGSLVLISTIDAQLNDALFAFGMAVFGAGFGLMASQLGNVIMSSVPQSDANEAGGLQGTAQNLGASLGTALIGSVLLLTLTNGFVNRIENDSSISQSARTSIEHSASKGIPVVTVTRRRRRR